MSSGRIGSPVEEFVNGASGGDNHSDSAIRLTRLTNMDQRQQKVACVAILGVAFVSGLAGFLFMFGYAHSSLSMIARLTRNSIVKEDFITEEIFERINEESLREYLKYLTLEPHSSGQSRDEKIAHWIRTRFEEFHMDFVSIDAYDVMLSFPKGPNKVS
jgi:hypothetical protein